MIQLENLSITFYVSIDKHVLQCMYDIYID